MVRKKQKGLLYPEGLDPLDDDDSHRKSHRRGLVRFI